MTNAPKARDEGEFGLIDRIRTLFPEIDLTDDCAALDFLVRGKLLFTTDAGIRGTHFPDSPEFMADAGFRTMAGAVSDINASGGRTVATVLALQIPENLTLSEFDDFMSGIRDFTRHHSIPLVGGNITRGEVFSATISAIGVAERPVGRDGATPGDIVFLTGPTGGSEAGRMLAMGEVPHDCVDAKTRDMLIRKYMRPSPPLKLGEKLAFEGATAMIDISDGFLADISHIARASGVGIEIELSEIPIFTGVADVAKAANIAPEKLAATSGEEFELVFTLPGNSIRIDRMPQNAVVVGAVVKGDGVVLKLHGIEIEIEKPGWRHF